VISPDLLTFTPANWKENQTVTVKGVDDQVDDDNIAWKVKLGSIISEDNDYNQLESSYVNVSTIDNDTARIINITSNIENGSYKANDNLTISVIFSEAVKVSGTPSLQLETGIGGDNATYQGGSGTDNLSFLYKVLPGATSSNLDYSSKSSLSGTIKSLANIPTDLTLPLPGRPGSLGDNKDLVIDTTAPKVSYVTSTSQDNKTSLTPHYKAGDKIYLTVVFNESVKVVNLNGNPRIQLETGSTDQYAYYSEDNDSKVGFTYQVSSGDNATDLDYKTVNALETNEGRIQDLAGNNAVLLLPPPGEENSLSHNKSLTIDTVAPSVTITGLSTIPGYPGTGPGPFKSGDNLSLSLTFSEKVQRIFPYTTQFRFNGGTYEDYDNISCNPNCKSAILSHTVKEGDGRASITVYGLEDLAGNVIENTPNVQDNFVVDNTPPEVSVIPTVCTRDLELNNGELRITADDSYFLKSWKKSNDSQTPSVGTLDNLSVSSKSFDNNSLTHTLDNTTCQNTEDWGGCEKKVYVWFEDFVGNISNLTFNSTNYDPVFSKVTNVTSSNPDIKSLRFPYYGPYDSIDIDVILSEKVRVQKNRPYIEIATGPSGKRSASFKQDSANGWNGYSASGWNNGYCPSCFQKTHKYVYIPRFPDNSADLAQFSDNITYNSSEMHEQSGCMVDNLTLPLPGSSNSLSANKQFVIDTEKPVNLTMDVKDHDNTTSNGQLYSDNITLGFTFSGEDNRGIAEWVVMDNKCPVAWFSTTTVSQKQNSTSEYPLDNSFYTNYGTGLSPADNSTAYSKSDNGTVHSCQSVSAQTGDKRTVTVFLIDLAGNVSKSDNSSSQDTITFDNQLPKPDLINLLYCGGQTGGTSPHTCGSNSDTYPGLGGASPISAAYAGHDEPNSSGFITTGWSGGSNNPRANLADNASFDATYRQPLSVEQVRIVYNEPIQTTITVNGAGSNACSGVLQISSDNFSTNSCLPLYPDTAATGCANGSCDNKTWSFYVNNLNNDADCPISPKGDDCRARFKDNTTYTLKLSSIKDSSFNSSDNLTTNFSTTPRPTVTGSSPDNDSTNKSVYTLPKFVFDSYMDPKSFIAGTSVLISPDNISFIPRFDHYQKTLSIHPMGPLPEDTEIAITVKGGFDNDTATGPQVDNGTYTYLQGNCKTQGPGMRDENLLTEGGTYGGGLQYCGDHGDERVFLKSDYQLTFKTRQSLNSGLVAHYTLDNNSFDHSTLWGADDSTPPNLASTPTSTFGRDNDTNGAYLFDGTDDYLSADVTDAGGTRLSGGNLTLCAWVYPTSFAGAGGNSDDVALSYGAGGNSVAIGFASNGGSIEIRGGSGVSATRGTDFDSHEYGLNRWTHLCASDNSTGLHLFADGELIKSTAGTSSNIAASGFNIGRDVNGGSGYFSGRVDDVKVYNRALSQGEVFDIYFEESRNLEGYYPLGADRDDYSGNGRNPTGASGATTTQAVGWTGIPDGALAFQNTTRDDDIVLPFNESLQTRDFTYIAWGFPETVANHEYRHKVLLSSARISSISGTSMDAASHESPAYASCTWTSQTLDNVSKRTSSISTISGVPSGTYHFGRKSPAGSNLGTALGIQTGHGIKVKEIDDNGTITNTTGTLWENIEIDKFYFVRLDSSDKIRLIEADGTGFVSSSGSGTNDHTYNGHSSLDTSLRVKFEVCNSIKTDYGGYFYLNNFADNNYLSDGDTTHKTGYFRGWFLEHHRKDTASGVHKQRFYEFYTDNTSETYKCWDQHMLDPNYSVTVGGVKMGCPKFQNTSTSNTESVDYKGWQLLAARGYGSTTSLFRNGLIQATNSARNTNLRFTDNLTIGGFEDRTNTGNVSNWKYYQYHGRIDDVRAYSRPLTNDEVAALYTVVDLHAPNPGDNGTVTDNGTHLKWVAAKDDRSDNTSLKYKVVYHASVNLINNVETALRNGTFVNGCDWKLEMINCPDNGTNRYYTILVKDQQENISSYTTKYRN